MTLENNTVTQREHPAFEDDYIAPHRHPSDVSDRLAFAFVKALRFVADRFFADRYGHRAVVLETGIRCRRPGYLTVVMGLLVRQRIEDLAVEEHCNNGQTKCEHRQVARHEPAPRKLFRILRYNYPLDLYDA